MILTTISACASMLVAYGLLTVFNMWGRTYLFEAGRMVRAVPWPVPKMIGPFEAPRFIGGKSQVKLQVGPSKPSVSCDCKEPTLETVRVSLIHLDEARWQVRIRALLINGTAKESVLDDLHTIVYARVCPTPLYATISYHGNAVILQDNTLLKEEFKPYSIRSGDGIELDVIAHITRYEGAPSYGPMAESKGPICIVFGLVADCYSANGDVAFQSVTSDSIYMFIISAPNDAPRFVAITRSNTKAAASLTRTFDEGWLLDTLNRHLSFRPERKRQ